LLYDWNSFSMRYLQYATHGRMEGGLPSIRPFFFLSYLTRTEPLIDEEKRENNENNDNNFVESNHQGPRSERAQSSAQTRQKQCAKTEPRAFPRFCFVSKEEGGFQVEN